MAYFLKKTVLKKRTYLSIVESFYSHEKRGAAHRTYKSLASVETWKAKGIKDPIAHFQQEVDALNNQRKKVGLSSFFLGLQLKRLFLYLSWASQGMYSPF